MHAQVNHTMSRLRYRTRDLEAAHDRVAETFSDHDIRVSETEALDFRLDLVPTPRLTIGRMAYGTQAVIHGPPIGRAYHINLPVTGGSTVAQKGIRRTFRAGTAGAAFGPDAPVMVGWSADSWQYHIKLPKDQLEAHAAKLIGRPIDERIDFDLTFDLETSAGQSLLATARFLHAELSRDGGVSAIPKACYELESALMTQLLMVVPNRLTPELHRKPEQSRRAKIREVIGYLDDHIDGQLTTADLAAIAGLSERVLQAGFSEVVGMSPSAYLRNARLDRAHLELISGTSDSVTDVAARWGFYHPGRFAKQYRDRFGTSPSATMRGGRR